MKARQIFDLTQNSNFEKFSPSTALRTTSPDFQGGERNQQQVFSNLYSRSENASAKKIYVQDSQQDFPSEEKRRPASDFQKHEELELLEEDDSENHYAIEEDSQNLGYYKKSDVRNLSFNLLPSGLAKNGEPQRDSKEVKKRREEFNRKFFEKRKPKKEKSKPDIKEAWQVSERKDISLITKRIEAALVERSKTPSKGGKLYDCPTCNLRKGLHDCCGKESNSNEKLQRSVDRRSHDWRQSSEKLEENKRKKIIDPNFLGSVRGSMKMNAGLPRNNCSISTTELFSYEPESKDEVYRNLKRFLEITEEELQDSERMNKSYKQQIDNLIEENKMLRQEISGTESKIEGLSKVIQKEKQLIKSCLVKNNLKFYDLNIYINNLDEYLRVSSSPNSKTSGEDTNSLKIKNDSIGQNLISIQLENEKMIKDLEKGPYSSYKGEFQSLENTLGRHDDFEVESSLRSELEKFRENEEISKKIIERLKRKLTQSESYLEKLLATNPNEKRGLKNTIEKLMAYEKKIESMEEAELSYRKKIELYERDSGGIKRELEQHKTLLKNFEENQQEPLPEFQVLNSKYDHINEYIVKLEGEVNQEKGNYLKLLEERELVSQQLELKEKEVESLKTNLNTSLEEVRSKENILRESLNERENLRQRLEQEFSLKQKQSQEAFEETIKRLEGDSSGLRKNLESSHKTIQELENRLILISTKQNEEKTAGNQREVVTAIEQLSLIILSKDARNHIMNDETKRLIKELFGENFSKVIDNYELQTQKLRQELEHREELLRNKDTKAYSYLKFAINLSDFFVQITDILERVNVRGGNVLTRLKDKMISQKRDLLVKNMELKRDKNICDEEREKLDHFYHLNTSNLEGRASLTPLFGLIELKPEDQLDVSETMYFTKEDAEENLVKVRAENEILRREIQTLQDRLLKSEVDKSNLSSQLTQQMSQLKVPDNPHSRQSSRMGSYQSIVSSGNVGNAKDFNSKSQIEAYQIKINEMSTQIKLLQEKLFEAELGSKKNELFEDRKSLLLEKPFEDEQNLLNQEMSLNMLLMQAISIEELLRPSNFEQEEAQEEAQREEEEEEYLN